MMDEYLYWLALDTIKENIDFSIFSKTLSKFGNVEDLWHSDRQELTNIGWSEKSINALQEAQNKININDFLKILYEIDEKDVHIITFNDKRYPPRLKSSATRSYQPPLMLFVRGKITGYDRIAAIVGNRNATHFAITKARNISRELASSGYTIISGLARGIDREAHLGALDIEGGEPWVEEIWLLEAKDRTQCQDFYSAQAAEAAMARIAPLREWQGNFQR